MKLFLLTCAMMVLTLMVAASTSMAAKRSHAHAHARARTQTSVHVGHVGPYCVFFVGSNGRTSPYRYRYNDWRYPRYYGGTHARALQNVGVSPADIGIRDSAW